MSDETSEVMRSFHRSECPGVRQLRTHPWLSLHAEAFSLHVRDGRMHGLSACMCLIRIIPLQPDVGVHRRFQVDGREAIDGVMILHVWRFTDFTKGRVDWR